MSAHNTPFGQQRHPHAVTPAGDHTAVPQDDHHSGAAMSRRKAQHLEICLDEERYRVESGTTRLSEVHLIHHSLPELNAEEVDTSCEFLDRRVAMPVFISSMTGGSEAAYQTNKDLAAVAQRLGIPVGMGSIRILFRKPEVLDHFRLKEYAPDVPVFANIGGVQLPQMNHDEIFEMLHRLDVDGVAVHLNPGQELFQPGGDRDFSGIMAALRRFVAVCPVPVIVKETGFGIHPGEIRRLHDAGVRYVDIAGSGGTNWVRVEALRHEEGVSADAAEEFDAWGLPTALVLAACGRHTPGVLASGGIRSGMDVARAVALGAESAGMALPFVRALQSGGVEAAVEFGRRLKYVMQTAMTLTGSRTVGEFRRCRLWMEDRLATDAHRLADACRDDEETRNDG